MQRAIPFLLPQQGKNVYLLPKRFFSQDLKRVKQSERKQVPREADVVIVGGGSVGCSTLYHLAKIGITNTVLIEAHQLTAGTTWHTAGLIWNLRPSDTEIQILEQTRKVLEVLENETGVNPGWINNGGLFIASRKERLDEFKRVMTLGKVFNIESHVLGPKETSKLYPLMNVNDVYGSLYVPSNGTIEPAGLCDALTRYATNKGAQVFQNCSAESIATDSSIMGGRQVTEITTSLGRIQTKAIVNATGCWGNDIAAMVGVTLPLVPLKHAYIVTEKISGIENMPNVRDHDGSIYLRLQGDALSVGGYEQNPKFIKNMDKNFPFGLFDLDWDIFGELMERAIGRVPILEKTGIKSTVCGPESFTPDHKPLMGEDPEVGGFYHAVGFNSAGMMLGGGCGQQMAQWISKGRPDLDMFAYDIRRFYPPLNSNKDWANQRSHEAYAKNYSIVFPHDEPLAGRLQRKSPLHTTLEAHGCIFQERHGWERPGWFFDKCNPVQPYDWYGKYDVPLNCDKGYQNSVEADYNFGYSSVHKYIRKGCIACRTKAAVFDMSYFGQLYLTGSEARKAADLLFSADMNRKPGSVVYTCMLKDNGGVEADLTVSILDEQDNIIGDPSFQGEGFYLAIGGAATTQNIAHIKREIRNRGWSVHLVDRTNDMALISLQGPSSKAIMETLVSDVDFSVEEFPFSTHKIIIINGHKIRALRLSFVGEMGWELHLPSSGALDVYKALWKAGEPFGLTNAGYRSMDSLSAEKGYKHWHADVRSDDTPLEAGLGFACKLKTDIDFIGRNSLLKQKQSGLRKKLVTLTLGGGPLWGLETIWKNDVLVGFIRRSEFAYALGVNIAYGYVMDPSGSIISKQYLSEGSWEVESMGNKRPCTVHTEHPFDPKNNRLKGHYIEADQQKIKECFLKSLFMEDIEMTSD